MGHLYKLDEDWKPLCTDTQFEIPTEHPIICMVHRHTREHACFAIKLNRFLSQQEAYDASSGMGV